MHSTNINVRQTKMKASRMCLKYKDTAEKTRKARTTSSHMTNMTTSTLHKKGTTRISSHSLVRKQNNKSKT
ncbi:unnamed protein product [Linum trigynum]|uniref:Uncharacterized protein n=1 Tax=Linum trigynum TaxID=586398 RepID=A0AAV2CHF6_9ROSI